MKRMSKKGVDRLQNLLLILLVLSAVALVLQLPPFQEGLDDRVQALLSAAPASTDTSLTEDLGGAMPSVHLVTTADSEYGRHAQLYLDADTDSLEGVLPLLREALGSAAEGTDSTHRALQAALSSPSLFLSLTQPIPGGIAALWLGCETAPALELQAMALTTEGDSSAALYLCAADGSITRYSTALTAAAIRDCVAAFAPNGGSFAFESSYSALWPYTVLVTQTDSYQQLRSALPDGYSAYNLLTALDFNAHTHYRHFETDGTEVVQESPRTLRIGADGTVVYSGDGYTGSSLYQVPASGETVTDTEALQASLALARALTAGTDAAPLYLHSLSATDTGWLLHFSYQVQGLPVLLSDGGSALSVTISGGCITAFTYRCRSFTALETLSPLLPPTMASAIAAQHAQADLRICYTDSGEELLSAQWLVG